jgi:hypothetical protein
MEIIAHIEHLQKLMIDLTLDLLLYVATYGKDTY